MITNFEVIKDYTYVNVVQVECVPYKYGLRVIYELVEV